MTAYASELDVQDILVLACDAIVSPMLFGDVDRTASRTAVSDLVLWSYGIRDSDQYVTVIGRTSREDIVHSSSMLSEYADQIVHLVRMGMCALSLRPVVLSDRLHLVSQTVALYLTLALRFQTVLRGVGELGPISGKAASNVPLVGARLRRVLTDVGRTEGCIVRGDLSLEQYTELCQLLVPARDWELADNRIWRARRLEEIRNPRNRLGT